MRKLPVLFVALAAMMGCRNDAAARRDGIEAPWPGYLVGGGHTPTDWVDDQDDYSRNEIAINWQGALVYLLAAVLE